MLAVAALLVGIGVGSATAPALADTPTTPVTSAPVSTAPVAPSPQTPIAADWWW